MKPDAMSKVEDLIAEWADDGVLDEVVLTVHYPNGESFAGEFMSSERGWIHLSSGLYDLASVVAVTYE